MQKKNPVSMTTLETYYPEGTPSNKHNDAGRKTGEKKKV